MWSTFIAHIPRYRGPSLSQYTPTNHIIPQILCLVFKLKAPPSSQKWFFSISYWQSNQSLLHISTTLTPVFNVLTLSVSAPSTPPPPTTFCLHFAIKSSIFIPPALSPSRLFILLLLAGDINPNPGPPRCLNITYANIRSINNKYPAIAKFISDNDTDLFAMSETWIRPDITSANLSEITPPGYSLYQQPWVARRGGGLGFFNKAGLDASVVSAKTCSTFENFLIKISMNKESFYFLNIYRPPSSSTSTFFEHFQSLLEDIHLTTENLAIIGDFNLHLETTCSNSKTFHSLISSYDFIQKVNFPTHIHGHTLDQVLTKSNNDNISNVHTTDAFSDHFSAIFTLNFLNPRSQNNATVSFRKYHKINKENESRSPCFRIDQ